MICEGSRILSRRTYQLSFFESLACPDSLPRPQWTLICCAMELEECSSSDEESGCQRVPLGCCWE